MTNPRHFLYLTIIYLGIVTGVCVFLWPSLQAAFMTNWGFNSLIVAALCVGIGINIYQILRLEPEIRWIKIFRTGRPGLSMADPPVLLAPLSKHLEQIHRDKFRLSALALTTVLDGIRGHLDESREISRYMISLLVFLGLLGTFWGLLQTISTVGQVIHGLDVGSQDFVQVFSSLKEGLEKPLQGMGTAFSSSLFGLGGSLVLGFVDIQAGHAQNRFFNEMEEWLTGVTHLVEVDDNPGKDSGRRNNPQSSSDENLRLLINQVEKSNQLMAHILHGQKKTAEKPPADAS